MDLTAYSISEIVELYSQTIKELKKRGVLRTKNVIGELGEYLVIEYYQKRADLPKLKAAPVGTKNVNALSIEGERYSIKSTSGNVTGVFYGLEPLDSKVKDKQLFEYVIICKLDEDCMLESIYELTWETFIKNKRWHSRMKAWNVALSKTVKTEARMIFERACEKSKINESGYDLVMEEDDIQDDNVAKWNMTEKVDLEVIKEKVARNVEKHFCCHLKKMSRSRYVSDDKEKALFIMAANYSEKNREYWYSINDENLPWLELYPTCHVAFVLGSEEKVLLFDYMEFKEMLKGCRKTKEDVSKKKKAHFHIAFAVEGENIAYFKKKLPENEFVNVSDALIWS